MLLVLELNLDGLARDGARHVRGDGRVVLKVEGGGGGGNLLGLGKGDGGHFDGVKRVWWREAEREGEGGGEERGRKGRAGPLASF